MIIIILKLIYLKIIHNLIKVNYLIVKNTKKIFYKVHKIISSKISPKCNINKQIVNNFINQLILITLIKKKLIIKYIVYQKK